MTRYLAIIHRESRTYSRCRRGCCGEGHTEGLFEKCYTEDRSEIVRFLVNSHVTAALHEADSEEKYGERTHTLVIDGFPEDEYVDEFSDEDAEKRGLLAEMATIKAEVQAEVEVRLTAARVKAAEAERLAKEKQIVDRREADLRRLAELERQKAELQAKLQETP
jgi:vacuolar-type H+-ATPase subunit I/STV1